MSAPETFDDLDAPPARRLRDFWRGPDRRRQERRFQDRRATDRSASAEADSMFGALVSADSQIDEGDYLGAPASPSAQPQRRSSDPRLDRSASMPEHRTGDTAATGASSRSDRARWQDGATVQRLFRKFVAARAVLGLVLVSALVLMSVFGVAAPLPMMLVAIGYAAQSLAMWLLPRLRAPDSMGEQLTQGQWLATVGVDLAVFLSLHLMQPVHSFNFVALLLMPVLMGGALATRKVALASAAAVVLALLVATWQAVAETQSGAVLWMQVGMVGVGFFAITLLAGEMAARLARESLAARSGLELARQQAQLNRLVIDEMSEGVLVVDQRLRVRAANPAARRLLVREGLGRSAPFHLSMDPLWHELETLIRTAFDKEIWPGGESKASLKFDDGVTRTLRVRARFTRRRSHPGDGGDPQPSEVMCVLFVEDMRTVQERMRQEKLAAMGRVSAGIAHEIRNPLAAIAQANALLSEEAQGAEQKMLTRMVTENVERLRLIVDDVMAVAPGREPTGQTIDAVTVVGHVLGEWSRAAGLPIGPGTRLSARMTETSLPVRFDPEHLRRILVNLLDNARRYATDTPGAITLSLEGLSAQDVMLSVASDGEVIGPDIEPYLFEPFFSTRSRGTGLGLYICRELCERYDGTIDYWKHPAGSRHVNEFRVVLRAAEPSDLSESRLLP